MCIPFVNPVFLKNKSILLISGTLHSCEVSLNVFFSLPVFDMYSAVTLIPSFVLSSIVKFLVSLCNLP